MTRSPVVACLLAALAVGCATASSGIPFPGPSRPYGGSPHVIPGLIEAEHYDEGGPGEAYQDADETNRGADYRGVTQVDIEQRADASNGYGIGWTRAGEWLAYTVLVRDSGTYTVEFPVASNRQGGIFHLEMNGVDVTGPIRIPDTGGWTTLEMIRKDNVRLEPGLYVMRLVMDENGESRGIGDIDYMRFRRVR